MKYGTFYRCALSFVLALNWCLLGFADDVKIIAPAQNPDQVEGGTLTYTENAHRLNLKLPAQYRAGHAFKHDLNRNSETINSGATDSAAEISKYNQRPPLMSIPMEFESSDLLLGTLAGTAMIAITLTNSEVKIVKEMQNHKSPAMDRTMEFGRKFGEDFAKTAITGSVVWALITDDNKKFTDIVPVQLQAVLAAGLVNNILKIMFRRALPTESPNDPYKTSESFHPPDHGIPSGHTTTAIVTAVIVSENLEKLGPIVPAILYTAAAITGVSRIYHNQHWATDVLASVYSYYLTKAILHKGENTNSRHHLVVQPLIDVRTRSFGLFAKMNLEPTVYTPCGSKYSGLERMTACVIEACKIRR